MLQAIRSRATSWVVKILFLLLILSFGIWGIGDIFRISVLAHRAGVDFNLAYVPPSFTETSSEPFDPVFMTKLFNLGYEAASAPGGFPWAKSAPGYDPGAMEILVDPAPAH